MSANGVQTEPNVDICDAALPARAVHSSFEVSNDPEANQDLHPGKWKNTGRFN
jgi:hypothetical protein